jgi:hypothetical protein
MEIVFISAEFFLYAVDDGALVEHNYYGDLDPSQVINAVIDKVGNVSGVGDVIPKIEINEENKDGE